MKYKNLTLTSLAVIAALGTVSVQAADWRKVDFNQPGTSGQVFQGSFDYNGKTYGPSVAVPVAGDEDKVIESKFDLKQLKTNTLYGKHASDDDASLAGNTGSYSSGAPVVYRIYRQDYSAVLVNLSRGTKGRDFVKSVVGEKTAPDTLTNGDYTYRGVTFSNFPRGDFNYHVKVTGPSSASGEGSFNLKGVMIPPAITGTGLKGTLDITNAVLATANLVQGNGGLVFSGAVSDISVGLDQSALWDKIGGNGVLPGYTLGLYGPGGKEIAGSVTGLPERIGTVAVIGSR